MRWGAVASSIGDLNLYAGASLSLSFPLELDAAVAGLLTIGGVCLDFGMAVVFFFCSAAYDLAELAAARRLAEPTTGGASDGCSRCHLSTWSLINCPWNLYGASKGSAPSASVLIHQEIGLKKIRLDKVLKYTKYP